MVISQPEFLPKLDYKLTVNPVEIGEIVFYLNLTDNQKDAFTSKMIVLCVTFQSPKN